MMILCDKKGERGGSGFHCSEAVVLEARAGWRRCARRRVARD